MKSFFCSILLATVLLLSCKSNVENSIIARVNDETIHQDEFRTRLLEYRVDVTQPMTSTPEDLEVKKKLLNELVEEKIMVQEAKRRSLNVSPGELDSAVKEVIKDYPGEGFEDQLKVQHISRARFRDRMRINLLRQKLVQEVTKELKNPSDDVIRKFYEANKDTFHSSAKTHVQQIVVKNDEDAQKVLEELENGAAFEELAKTHSFTPEAAQGGDLGFISKGTLPKAVEDAIARLPVGKPSEAISTDYGFHILKVLEKRPEHTDTFEEARPKIIATLMKQEREDHYGQWRKETLSKAKVQRNHVLLASIF